MRHTAPMPEHAGTDSGSSLSSRCPILEGSLLLDLEANGERIYHIGAVLGDRVFERKGRFDLAMALKDLDAFGEAAVAVLGHNLIGHDLPILRGLRSQLRLLSKPVVDTLYLSPLAFPENPYHHLVKDHKLVRTSVNDPVADARLAARVFGDQWQSFRSLVLGGHSSIVAFYRHCFLAAEGEGTHPYDGIAGVLEAAGGPQICRDAAASFLLSTLESSVCVEALRKQVFPLLDSPTERPALAYVLSWLRVAGGNSVIPPWVFRRFPLVSHILDWLRDSPCGSPGCSYCRETHNPGEQLRRFFGYASFRPSPATEDGSSLQERITSEGIHRQPLLAILPTGGGKSLCYQLPALVRYARRGTLTLVITPLQALMKDQVDNLTAKTGTPCAAALCGLLTPPERGDVLERVRLGDVAILYISPEQLRNRTFRRIVSTREIGAWVFDEAHCLSKWGHDFRPDYLYAGRFIRELAAEQRKPIPPVSCFTATARQDVRQEILEFFRKELGQELAVFEAGVERENLRFDVQIVSCGEKLEAIHTVLSDRLSLYLDGCAIVYTATRRRAEDVAAFLQLKQWGAAAFHGGMNAPAKRAVQEAFLAGDLRVIAATNAFGMGIDKENIRLVVHADIPGSLESYLQEAGRAGRDLRDAECVLLYDEQDIETQFKLGALSRLTQRDIIQILKGLKRAAHQKSGDLVITTGELLRDEEVETNFDADAADAETRVKTAIAWLEKAQFVERNENLTRVFQGRLLVKSLDEAASRIARLNLPAVQQRRWLGVIQALINADVDDRLKADDLAELAEFKEPSDSESPVAERTLRTSEKVLRTLHQMAEAGLIEKGVLLTAFVRHKVKDSSRSILQRIRETEERMLRLLQEEGPDAAELGWQDLSLRRVNQRLRDAGVESSPEVIRGLLKSLSMDGKGLAASRGSLQVRHVSGDHFRVKLLRSWEALRATSEKRRSVAAVMLDCILSSIPEDAPPSAEMLVSFATEDLFKALRSHLYLSQNLKDPLAAIDRGLLFLHEQKIIILQQGLSVFRQAMSLRILPQSGNRRYTKHDYEPLSIHYRERVFQVHVMNEYARRGVEKISQALDLVLAYFTLDKSSFIRRFFPGRKDLLDRAVSEGDYRRIVEELEDPAQIAVVTAGESTNMLVLAGPGAGKTRVVVHRCAYLLRVLRARPESILVVCFNHSAAVTLRHRLFELLGEDSRGVTVQTYHGIAMRITGTSFADMAEWSPGGELPFDRLIPEAISVLKGQRDLGGLQPDDVRDRLLGRFRHILVDEYQDIDTQQYDLISALAGRLESDPDRKLTILAVGDDDQNIYTFRGANVQFILRFQEDYQAKVHYLVQNYRSTGHIISASNALIRLNRDRMKTGHPIAIDHRRAHDPPGGLWGRIDPMVGGRVQILQVESGREQLRALRPLWRRMRERHEGLLWSDMAVLSRSRDILAPVRAVAEDCGIPICWGLNRKSSPSLHRVREIHRFFERLREERGDLRRASQLESLRSSLASGEEHSPWWGILEDLLLSWRAETADSELPVSLALEFFSEGLAEMRRENRMGRGVLLSTVHGAKGMEFDHVFVLDGDWPRPHNRESEEEERRVFYVAMTRARRTLTLFQRSDSRNTHLNGLQGDHIVTGKMEGLSEDVPEEACSTSYETLGMDDLDLGFAGRFPQSDPIHGHVARLRTGSELFTAEQGVRLVLRDVEGNLVAGLSRRGAERWLPRLSQVRSFRVLGMLKRTCRDEGQAFQAHCRAETWEVPWIEAVCVKA